jgi:hypothetical protein
VLRISLIMHVSIIVVNHQNWYVHSGVDKESRLLGKGILTNRQESFRRQRKSLKPN